MIARSNSVPNFATSPLMATNHSLELRGTPLPETAVSKLNQAGILAVPDESQKWVFERPTKSSHLLYIGNNPAASKIEIGCADVIHDMREATFGVVQAVNDSFSRETDFNYAFHENHYNGDFSSGTNMSDFARYHPAGLVFVNDKRAVHYHLHVISNASSTSRFLMTAQEEIDKNRQLHGLLRLMLSEKVINGKPLFGLKSDKTQQDFNSSSFDTDATIENTSHYDALTAKGLAQDADFPLELNLERSPRETWDHVSGKTSAISANKRVPQLPEMFDLYQKLSFGHVRIDDLGADADVTLPHALDTIRSAMRNTIS